MCSLHKKHIQYINYTAGNNFRIQEIKDQQVLQVLSHKIFDSLIFYLFLKRLINKIKINFVTINVNNIS